MHEDKVFLQRVAALHFDLAVVEAAPFMPCAYFVPHIFQIPHVT